MTNNAKPYIGRFAPSPTGPLHLGSLCTALASYLDARQHNGRWLLRIDDLDIPRNQMGAELAIQECLQAFGLLWDGDVYYQSQHLAAYELAIQQLAVKQQLFACVCSRKELEQQGSVYPGHCRDKAISAVVHAIRLKVGQTPICFQDRLHGLVTENLVSQHGDFVIKRKDGIIAYQLAVVIDDFSQQITHVVRGGDLLDSTPKQIYLQSLLNYPHPQYLHVPVIVDATGNKLSKQTFAAAVDFRQPEPVLWQLLNLLRQNPPITLRYAGKHTILAWAIENWQPANLKKISAIQESLV